MKNTLTEFIGLEFNSSKIYFSYKYRMLIWKQIFFYNQEILRDALLMYSSLCKYYIQILIENTYINTLVVYII